MPTLRIVVPPVGGPPAQRDDGSFVPAAASLLEVTPSGMRYLGTAVPGA